MAGLDSSPVGRYRGGAKDTRPESCAAISILVPGTQGSRSCMASFPRSALSDMG